jgi:hypothetical protein
MILLGHYYHELVMGYIRRGRVICIDLIVERFELNHHFTEICVVNLRWADIKVEKGSKLVTCTHGVPRIAFGMWTDDQCRTTRNSQERL